MLNTAETTIFAYWCAALAICAAVLVLVPQ